jgi:biopolymer transport protein ExbB
MWHWISQGGPLVYPILLLSIIALAVGIERLVLYLTQMPLNAKVRQSLRQFLKQPGDAKLKYILPEHVLIFPLIEELASAVRGPHLEEKLILHIERIRHRLNLRLPWFSVIAAAAPLMGLLGTVLGMIDVFGKVAATASAPNITLLADGIWQALISTALGLAVAIPALLLWHFFKNLQVRILFNIEDFANELLWEMGKSDKMESRR